MTKCFQLRKGHVSRVFLTPTSLGVNLKLFTRGLCYHVCHTLHFSSFWMVQWVVDSRLEIQGICLKTYISLLFWRSICSNVYMV